MGSCPGMERVAGVGSLLQSAAVIDAPLHRGAAVIDAPLHQGPAVIDAPLGKRLDDDPRFAEGVVGAAAGVGAADDEVVEEAELEEIGGLRSGGG
jgi:hypothetical protein